MSEYLVSVQLIQQYTKWIFSPCPTASPLEYWILHQADQCFHKYWITITFFSLLNLLSQFIEYLIGNHWVIWSLSKPLGPSDSIGYWISDVGLPIASHYPLDTLAMSIKYWLTCITHIQYYLCYYQIFGLNALRDGQNFLVPVVRWISLIVMVLRIFMKRCPKSHGSSQALKRSSSLCGSHRLQGPKSRSKWYSTWNLI